MTDNRPLRVFLSYASQDKPLVREISRRLTGEGWIETWQDEKNLLPGQDWRVKIEEAVEDADVVIICLSNQSVTKEGHVQKELRYAREIALEKPEDAIFLIPLRLDESEVPRGLRFYQWVDYFEAKKDDSYKALVASLKLRYEQKLKAEAEEEERLRREQQEREIAEKIAREKAEKEAAERARLQAEEEEQQRIAKEKAEREAVEKATREKTEKARLAAQEEQKRIAREKAEREIAEKVAREKAEKETAEKLRLKAEEDERQRIAKEKAEHEAAEKAAREKAKKIAAEEVRLKKLGDLKPALPNNPIRNASVKNKTNNNTAAVFGFVGFASIMGFIGVIVFIIVGLYLLDQYSLLAPIPSSTFVNTPVVMSPTTFIEVKGKNWIVFEKHFVCSLSEKCSNLWVINADGSGLRQLTSGTNIDENPVFSPDGNYLAFERNDAIYTIRFNGSDLKKITDSGRFPNWLSMNAILYNSAAGTETEYWQQWRLAVVSLDNLTEDILDIGQSGVYRPLLSPDKRYLLFSVLESSQDYSLYVAEINGQQISNMQILYNENFDQVKFPAVWYSDSSYLEVLAAHRSSNYWRCWKLKPTGSIIDVVNEDGDCMRSWSPDGSMYVYSDWDEGLWIVNDTQKVLLLSDVGGYDAGPYYDNPIWSP